MDAEGESIDYTEDIEKENITLDRFTFSPDHAIYYWEDPESPQNFVSIVLFLPPGVPPEKLYVSVPSTKNKLAYSYDRPSPARDGNRLCKRWTSSTSEAENTQEYYSFVKGFYHFFKLYRHKDDEMIQSHGTISFDDGITV